MAAEIRKYDVSRLQCARVDLLGTTEIIHATTTKVSAKGMRSGA